MECRRVWIAVVMVIAGSSIVFGIKEGDICYLDNGQRGVCTSISRCQSALEGLKNRIYPKNCFINGFTPVVCCQDTTPAPTPQPTRPTRPTGVTPGGQKRLSEKACEDYRNSLVHETFDAVLLPTVTRVNKSDCEYTSTTLIVGGEDAKEREFPHMAVLGYIRPDGMTSWDCGGSLISSRFILTAAHCVTSSSLGKVAVVRLGALTIEHQSKTTTPRDYRVVRTHVNPDYKYPSHYNDIALLELEKDVVFDEYVRPACLHTNTAIPKKKAIASGWGAIGYGDELSDRMLKVQLDIIPNEECKTYYKREAGTMRLRQGIADTMLCSGVIEGAKDTCQGDSGGPLQIVLDDRRCIYHIIGVVSFGRYCGFAYTPGVYSRVSSFVDWIESVVWKNVNRWG